MSWIAFRRTCPHCAPRALLLLGITACLPACSNLSDLVKPGEALRTGPLLGDYRSELPKLPDIPEHLKHCVTEKTEGKTADQIVLNQKQTIEEQRACQDALIKWYADVQKAQAAKVSSASPERKPDQR